jgi:hypothetical protein
VNSVLNLRLPWNAGKLSSVQTTRDLSSSVQLHGVSYWQLRISWCEAPSLTRGYVCNLLVQLLLGLVRAVTLGSEFHRTHDHIPSHLRPPTWRARSPYLYPPGTGWPCYTPGHWVERILNANQISGNNLSPTILDMTWDAKKTVFFSVIPFYLQSVLVHSANCVNNV